MSNEYMIFVRSVRGKSLIDEREALMKNFLRLRKEIKNEQGKPSYWKKAKLDKLHRVWDQYCEVNDLIVAGHVTRNRANT